MSAEQWGALMRGDESYAGASSFYRLKEALDDIFGFEHFVPTHQGRAAEHILCTLLINPGDPVPSNAHFDTTEANIRARGGRPVNLAIDEAASASKHHPFKGNIDLGKLDRFIEEHGPKNIPLGMVTITNNAGGGHAIYIDAGGFLPHISSQEFPGISLSVELYLEGGVRGVELGSVAFEYRDPETGEISSPPMELVRLAIPRRVYTQAHLDYVFAA